MANPNLDLAQSDILNALGDESASVFGLIDNFVFGDIVTDTNEIDLSSVGGNILIGTPDNNTLNGSNGITDIIVGLDGDDNLNGRSGNDIISGGLGNDAINGGAGEDLLLGGRGDDFIDGGSGNDLILGGLGNDIIDGGDGNDTILGGRGNDIIDGGDGNDLLRGGSGNDILKGGEGDDVLRGEVGDDVLKGDAGNDTLLGGAGDDYLDGGAGRNAVAGGAGADIFAIGNDGFSTVSDFNLIQGDQLALKGSLSVDELTFTDRANGTTISADGTGIAFLRGISADTVSANTDAIFTTVAAQAISVSFESINLPESIDFGAEGSVTLNLTNTFGHDFSGPVTLNLYISTDDNRDSASDVRNDGLLRQLTIDVNLAAGASTTVELDYENLTSVISPGSYHLLAGVEGGELTNELVSAPGADSVIVWNATALNAIQEFGETNPVGLPPTVGSRAMAILQTSVFNAVNAFDGSYEFYEDLNPGTPVEGASQDAAVAGASLTALASLFPGNEDLRDTLLDQLQASLGLDESQVNSLLSAAGIDLTPSAPGAAGTFAEIFVDPFLTELPTPTGATPGDVPADILSGFLLGVEAASQVLNNRSDDGFTGFFQGIDDPTTYSPAGAFEDYVWTPAATNPLFPGVPFALSPGWGQLRTFSGADRDTDYIDAANIDTNNDGSLLDGRPFGNDIDPVVNRTAQNRYIDEINQVQTLGGLEDTDTTNVTRSQDQTEVAIFWAYDRSDTFRPYGQLFEIAQAASIRNETDLLDSARTLALTSIALADSAITAWFAKYQEQQPRPVDVISGDGGQGTPISEIDGFDETVPDFDWRSLLPTPPFPDVLSGHSTFAGAFGGVLDTLFNPTGPIEVVSQELVRGNAIVATTDNSLFDINDFNFVRTFESYGEIGFEDAVSRVYGGIHVFEAIEDARIVGNVIGEYVANNLLATAPTTLA